MDNTINILINHFLEKPMVSSTSSSGGVMIQMAMKVTMLLRELTNSLFMNLKSSLMTMYLW